MELIYHNESFKLKDIGFPLKDIHIIDNWLPVQLHYWIDEAVSQPNIWSKNNQVTGDSPTGLPHHQFWGATMMKGTNSSLIEVGNYPDTDPEINQYLDTKCCAKWLDRKLQTDFGFEWVRFQYMGLNSQTQGLHGTTHSDCQDEDEWNLSFLYYTNKIWSEHWGGPLRIYDEMQQGLHGRANHIKNHQIAEIPFKPNRLVVFDGRIPHGADAPTEEARYIDRKSIVIRGDEIRLVEDDYWFRQCPQ
jgi:hypothetical protein